MSRFTDFLENSMPDLILAAADDNMGTIQALLQDLNEIPGITSAQRLQALNQVGVYGETALMRATFYGRIEIVGVLLQELNAIPGITPEQKLQALNQADNEGDTAITIAHRGNHHGMVAILKKAKDDAEYEQARALGVTLKRLPFAKDKDVVSVIMEYDLRASGSLEQKKAFWEGYNSINLFEPPLPHEAQSQDDLSASSSVSSKRESLPSAVEEPQANFLTAYEARNKRAFERDADKQLSSSTSTPKGSGSR